MTGQEDPTQEFDGEIQLTAFNMKEELEEGHVDKDGTTINCIIIKYILNS